MIKTLSNTHSQGRVSNGEMNMLSALGEQLKLDPELSKLLTPEGELPADFSQALKEMSFEDAQKLVESLNKETDLAGAKQEALNQQLQEILPQNVERLGAEKVVTRPALGEIPVKEPQSAKELHALLNQGQKGQVLAGEGKNAQAQAAQTAPWETAAKAKNAEDASRAFVPERKSIFAVQKERIPVQALAKTEAAAKQTTQVQNTQGLVDLNQFMAKQTPDGKQRALKAQYKNEQQSLFANKTFAQKHMPHIHTPEAPLLQEGESLNLDDWSQGQEQLLGKNETSNIRGAGNGAKVFDLGALNKTNNLDSVISQIQDYVMQAKAAKEPSAQMTFNHPELGDVDILVRKGAGDQVHIAIAHNSQEAAKFFKQHQGELLQSLQQSGVQVGEFKLEQSSSSNTANQNNNSNNPEQNGKQQFANQQRSGHEQQRKEDSHRREELWNLLREERKSA